MPNVVRIYHGDHCIFAMPSTPGQTINADFEFNQEIFRVELVDNSAPAHMADITSDFALKLHHMALNQIAYLRNLKANSDIYSEEFWDNEIKDATEVLNEVRGML